MREWRCKSCVRSAVGREAWLCDQFAAAPARRRMRGRDEGRDAAIDAGACSDPVPRPLEEAGVRCKVATQGRTPRALLVVGSWCDGGALAIAMIPVSRAALVFAW